MHLHRLDGLPLFCQIFFLSLNAENPKVTHSRTVETRHIGTIRMGGQKVIIANGGYAGCFHNGFIGQKGEEKRIFLIKHIKKDMKMDQEN